jgi:hypothetical protein
MELFDAALVGGALLVVVAIFLWSRSSVHSPRPIEGRKGAKRPSANSGLVSKLFLSGDWRSWEAPLDIVAGESRYGRALRNLTGPARENGYLIPTVATLTREPSNAFDPNAIKVKVRRHQVGYIMREVAALLAPHMDSLGTDNLEVAAIIRGGYEDAPNVGVHLWLHRSSASGPIFRLTESEALEVSWPPNDDEGK